MEDKLSNIQKSNKKYYQKNKDIILKELKNKEFEKKEIIYAHLQGKCCVDCGNTDIRVFEFDHIYGIKNNDINILLKAGRCKEKLILELEKCEIVCGNCHRIRSDKRIGGSYRTLSEEELYEKGKSLCASGRTKIKRKLYVLNHLKENPCMDCGNDDIKVLEFDHRDREEKIANISRLVGNSNFQTLKDEIPKCDVVCRNCHIIRERTREKDLGVVHYKN